MQLDFLKKGSPDRGKRITAWAIFLSIIVLNLAASLQDGLQVIDLLVILLIVYAVTGLLIALHQPVNRVGWSMLVGSLLLALNGTLGWYLDLAKNGPPGAFPLAPIMAWGTTWLGNAGFGVLLLFTMFLFPDGQPPSPRWKPLFWFLFSLIALSILVSFGPGPLEGHPEFNNPFGVPALGGSIRLLMTAREISLLPSLAICMVSIWWRYRTGGSGLKRKIRWVVFGAGLSMSVILLGYVIFDLLRAPLPQAFADGAWALANLIFPISICIAILNSHLYDIDIVIRRTVTYALVTAFLAVDYYGSVILLQQLFRSLTGETSPVAIVLSTLVIAALFNPIRTRMQRLVDRRFFRQQYNAERTMERFSGHLRDEVDLGQLTGLVQEVVQDTVQPESLSLWLRRSEQGSPFPDQRGSA